MKGIFGDSLDKNVQSKISIKKSNEIKDLKYDYTIKSLTKIII